MAHPGTGAVKLRTFGWQFFDEGLTGRKKQNTVVLVRRLNMADNLQGSLNLLVLKLLAKRAPLHGYSIMAAIQEASEEILRVEQGSLYPALHRMEEDGWISAEWTVRENGKKVRAYSLTKVGRQELERAEERWATVTGAVNRVLRMA